MNIVWISIIFSCAAHAQGGGGGGGLKSFSNILIERDWILLMKIILFCLKNILILCDVLPYGVTQIKEPRICFYLKIS